MVADEVKMEWNEDSLAATPANESALLRLAAGTPELQHIANLLKPDRDSIGSRAPYFHAATSEGDLILKLNLPEVELQWSTIVATEDPDLAPRTYGSGTLGDSSITWLLQERVGSRLGTSRTDNEVMMNAGARFHLVSRHAARPAAPGGHPQDAAELVGELRAASLVAGAPKAAAVLTERAYADWARLFTPGKRRPPSW